MSLVVRVKCNRLRKNESYTVHGISQFALATGLKTWSREDVRRSFAFNGRNVSPIEIHHQPIAAQEDCVTRVQNVRIWCRVIENGRKDRMARHIMDDCQRSTSRETDFVQAGHMLQWSCPSEMHTTLVADATVLFHPRWNI